MQWQLWAYPIGGDTTGPVQLPQPQEWDATYPISDVGALNITFPLTQPGIDVLYDYCDVETRYLDGSTWRCPPNGRFSLATITPDVIAEMQMPVRRYMLQSWGWLLRGILQAKTTGLNDDAEREFPGKTIAQAIGVLIDEAHTLGAVTDLTWEIVSDSGAACDPVQPGTDVASLLSTAVQQGLMDWQIVADSDGQGRKLAMYSALGTDRSSSVDLQPGRDVIAAPATLSAVDVRPAVLVQGDDGHFQWMTSDTADAPYGNLAVAVNAGGAWKASQLTVSGNAALRRAKTWRTQATMTVRFDSAQYLPFADYGLGDKVLAPGALRAVPAAQRVAQIAVQQQSNGSMQGTLTLGERFVTGREWLHRQLSQTVGDGWNYNWNPKPPKPYTPPTSTTGFYSGTAPEYPSDGDIVATSGSIVPTVGDNGLSGGARPPLPRVCTTSVAALGGDVYVLDTRGDSGGSPLYRLDPSTGDWSTLAELDDGASAHGQILVADDAKLYACGGVAAGSYIPAARAFDPDAGAWGSELGSASWDAADSTAFGYAGVIGGTVFYGGGEH